jgi:hypothetical protein
MTLAQLNLPKYWWPSNPPGIGEFGVFSGDVVGSGSPKTSPGTGQLGCHGIEKTEKFPDLYHPASFFCA